jgi:serine/threonine protein kinase/TolB-like protein
MPSAFASPVVTLAAAERAAKGRARLPPSRRTRLGRSLALPESFSIAFSEPPGYVFTQACSRRLDHGAAVSLATGTVLGTYEILAPLGVGGMGEVYRARDSKLQREVAVKVLRTELAEDEERLGRFRREAKLLAQLNHPNVATIHDLQEEGATQFLVMELVTGQTLSHRLRAGPLTIRETLALARQIAEALEAAHARGVIHRDLKPSNIKITPEGRVKILDFGLAKALESHRPPSEDSFQTASMDGLPLHKRTVLGTPAYMSPEQVNAKPADQRADIWSFGCVLYEAVSGRQPFCGETIVNTLAAVIGRDPDWKLLPADLPSRFRALIRACLSKDPDGRPRDVGIVRRELEQVARELAGGGLDSDPVTQLAKPDSPVRLTPFGPESRTEPMGAEAFQPTTKYDSASLAAAVHGPARKGWLGPRWLLPTMLCVALTTAAIYLLKDRFLPIDSVAVLPLTVASSDEAVYGEWSRPLAAEITNRLSQNAKLTVAPQEKVAKVTDVRQISRETTGKRLQVRALVTGGIHTASQRSEIVVDVELHDTWTGRILWERSFRRKTDADAAALAAWRAEVANETAQAVLGALGK